MQTDGRPMTAAKPPERFDHVAEKFLEDVTCDDGPEVLAKLLREVREMTIWEAREWLRRHGHEADADVLRYDLLQTTESAVEKRERALRAALQHMSDEGLLDCIDGDTPPEERCGQCSCCVASAALAAAGGKL